MIKSDSVFKLFKSRDEFDEWLKAIDPSVMSGLPHDIDYPILIELPIGEMHVFPANEVFIITHLLAELAKESETETEEAT